MPRQDTTGPMGVGPGTGKKMGPCGKRSGLGMGRGYGRAMCSWFYRTYQAMPEDERKELLQSEIEDLKQDLQMIEEELKGLEK
ncbi:MAG: DUF5320 domain-containing protein [Candidatus Moranbacteria bacterium]|nr:DUF5320 domain-containing protein [Candidatus Moranbacteria bacterium]